MLLHNLSWINLSVYRLKLWRSDYVQFSLPYSQIANLPIIIDYEYKWFAYKLDKKYVDTMDTLNQIRLKFR